MNALSSFRVQPLQRDTVPARTAEPSMPTIYVFFACFRAFINLSTGAVMPDGGAPYRE